MQGGGETMPSATSLCATMCFDGVSRAVCHACCLPRCGKKGGCNNARCNIVTLLKLTISVIIIISPCFVIFAIIIVSCVSVASCLCFTYMSIIGIRAGVRALPSMWDVNKWQVERQRMIEENRSRYRPAIEIENLQRAIEIQEIERRNYIIS